MTARDWAESDYARIYQSIRNDPKFDTVRDDERALGAYVRLLMEAELTFPAHPLLPASLSRYARNLLIKAGLLLISGSHYTISGLKAEREARYGAGRGRKKYPSDGAPKPETSRSDSVVTSESIRNPRAGAGAHSPSPSFSESSSTEERGAGERNGEGVVDDLDGAHLWLSKHRADVPYEGRAGLELAQLVRQHGTPRVIAAMETLGAQHDGRQYIFGVLPILNPIPHPAAVSKADRDRAEVRSILDAVRDNR